MVLNLNSSFHKCECEHPGLHTRSVLGVKTVFTSYSPTFVPKEVLTTTFDSPEVKYFPPFKSPSITFDTVPFTAGCENERVSLYFDDEQKQQP